MAKKIYYKPEIFLSDYDLEKEIIAQTNELIDYLNGGSDISKSKYFALQQTYIDVLNKYKDVMSLSEQALKDIIDEYGYSYLSNLFDLSKERLQMLVLYLPLIEMLKATKTGLELIFAVLGLTLTIQEWWENPSNLEILSYILYIDLVNVPVDSSVADRVLEFSRQYVYPLLVAITYTISYRFNKTPYFGMVSTSKTILQVYEDILYLVWAYDYELYELWSDEEPYQIPPENMNHWQLDENADTLIWDEMGDFTPPESLWYSSSSRTVWEFEGDLTDKSLLNWWMRRLEGHPDRPEQNWSVEVGGTHDTRTYWS